MVNCTVLSHMKVNGGRCRLELVFNDARHQRPCSSIRQETEAEAASTDPVSAMEDVLTLSGPVTMKQSEEERELRIVLLGKTGTGKSATANTILGRKEFESRASSASVTADCKAASCKFNGEDLKLIDTPGLFDTTVCNDEIMKEVARSVVLSAPGPHAILLVLQVGRFTPEEENAVNMVRDLFGPGAEKHLMVLFTRKDDLEEDQSIESFVKDPKGKFMDLIVNPGRPYCAFNNKLREEEAEQQRRDLYDAIKGMVGRNKGGFYTNGMYEMAQRALKEREEEKRRKIQEEKEREIAKIKREAEKLIERRKKENNGQIAQLEKEKIHENTKQKWAEIEHLSNIQLKNARQEAESDIMQCIKDGVTMGAKSGAVAGGVTAGSVGAVGGMLAAAEMGAMAGAVAGPAGVAVGAVAGAAVGALAGTALGAAVGSGVGVVAGAVTGFFNMLFD